MEEKTPELRFEGFEEGWEEKILNSISERVTRKNTNNESTLPLTISAQYGLVDQRDFFNSQIASKDVSGYYLIKNGEFAYNKSYSSEYPFGAIKRLDFYDKGVLSTLYILFSVKNIKSDYLLAYYDSTYWYKEIIKIAAEGARNHGLLNVAPEDFFNTKLFVPKSESEQQQIGSFFKNIDQQILLTQEKLEKTKSLKKTMLQKMFPKKDSKLPEIRLEGFSGDWEEKPLNNYLYVSTETNSEGKYGKNEVLSVSGDFGVINQIEFQGRSFAGASVSNYGVVQTGDIVYTKSPLRWQPYGIIKTNKGVPGIVSVLYGVYHPKENIYPNFVQNYFESDNRLNEYLRVLVNKGAKNTLLISDEDALSGQVVFPSIEEQKAISCFLDNLSEMITTESKKLELLKKLKKSLLKKLFV